MSVGFTRFRPGWTGLGLVTLAAAGFGTSPFFAGVLYRTGLEPELVTLLRFGVPALLLAPFLRLHSVLAAEGARMAVLGAANAAGMLAYFRALESLPVSTAVLVYYTYPLFSVLIGWTVYGHRPTRETLSAIALVVTAVVLAVSPQTLSLDQRDRLALCFLAPLVFAVIIQYLATPIRPMAPVQRLGTSLLGHLAVLVPVVLSTTAPVARLAGVGAGGWLAVAGIGILSAALPQYLFTVGAPRAGAERTTVAGAVELVVAVLLGALAFGEAIGRNEAVAVVLVIIALVSCRGTAPARPPRGRLRGRPRNRGTAGPLPGRRLAAAARGYHGEAGQQPTRNHGPWQAGNSRPPTSTAPATRTPSASTPPPSSTTSTGSSASRAPWRPWLSASASVAGASTCLPSAPPAPASTPWCTAMRRAGRRPSPR
jgi:drug/metabolite transporter (DMT)-like permease